MMKQRKEARLRPKDRTTRGAPGVAETASRIRSTLQSLADPEKARGGQAFFREPVHLYGVSATASRGLAREVYEEVKDFWSWKEAVGLADTLLPDPYLEVKSVALLVLGRFVRDAPVAALFHKSKSWLQAGFCNNWASVDTLCPEVIAPLLAKRTGLIKQIKNWPLSRNRWIVRASAVSLIPLARRGTALEAAYTVARRLFSSDDDLIHKAAGWMLREAGKADLKRLERFLLAHGPAIPRTTLRYAIERFSSAKRKLLLLKTRRSRVE